MLRKYFLLPRNHRTHSRNIRNLSVTMISGSKKKRIECCDKTNILFRTLSRRFVPCCRTCWQTFFKGRFVFICFFRLRRVTDRLERLSLTSAIYWLLPPLDYFAINRRKTFKSVIIIIFTFADFEFTFLQFNCDNGHDERTRRCSFVRELLKSPFFFFPCRWSILLHETHFRGLISAFILAPNHPTRPSHNQQKTFPACPSRFTYSLCVLMWKLPIKESLSVMRAFPDNFQCPIVLSLFCGGANGRGKWFLNSGKVIWDGWKEVNP